MSSTYSPNLRIELIGNGDQAGAWGTTTNSNLSYVLDTSIAGYQAITVTSAAQVLTYVNGPTPSPSLNQSVYSLLKLNSAAAASSIYAPPSSKQYIIWNNTSYALTFYNSTVIGNTTAAGLGVAVPAGEIMAIWTNGVSFYQQNTAFIDPHLSGTPTAPTASVGTNTTQIATTAFVATSYAPLASPTFTGTPSLPTGTTAVTQTATDDTTKLATTAFVQDVADAIKTALFPIGAIYTATVATNPGTLLGFGTWAAFGAGRVLIGNGGGFTAGDTGGSADAVVVSHNHTATTTITDPGHAHTLGFYSVGGTANDGMYANASNTVVTTNSATTGITASTTNTAAGVSGTNANLQPYIVVYMWQRTA